MLSNLDSQLQFGYKATRHMDGKELPHLACSMHWFPALSTNEDPKVSETPFVLAIHCAVDKKKVVSRPDQGGVEKNCAHGKKLRTPPHPPGVACAKKAVLPSL